MDQMKRVAILGCTGSIGTQALDVCRQHLDKLRVVALSAHSRTTDLVSSAREFNVPRIAVTDPAHYDDQALLDLPDSCSLYKGPQSAIDICMDADVDMVLVSIVGAAGLSATYQLIAAGKQVALANKESLVVGGELIMPMVKPGQMLPVDSEHSAIFQCYQGENPRQAHCIWLTCSGGPFFGRTRGSLASVTPADALAHPTWNMGAKITIDSATLMNKGLERIEAMHLFDVAMDDIVVVIQRQSKIHSMVEFDDGSVIAHLGASDMRIPVQYAFSYPQRWATPAPRVDFRALGGLDFDEPDMESFRCLKLADCAGRDGGTMPCVLNAANEVAVDSFLRGSCSFTGIDEVVEECLASHTRQDVESLEQLLDVDAWARDRARQAIRSRVR